MAKLEYRADVTLKNSVQLRHPTAVLKYEKGTTRTLGVLVNTREEAINKLARWHLTATATKNEFLEAVLSTFKREDDGKLTFVCKEKYAVEDFTTFYH